MNEVCNSQMALMFLLALEMMRQINFRKGFHFVKHYRRTGNLKLLLQPILSSILSKFNDKVHKLQGGCLDVLQVL